MGIDFQSVYKQVGNLFPQCCSKAGDHRYVAEQPLDSFAASLWERLRLALLFLLLDWLDAYVEVFLYFDFAQDFSFFNHP